MTNQRGAMFSSRILSPGLTADPATLIACWAAIGCAVLLVPSVPAALIDTRLLNGVSVWSKPIKFQFSFALHWFTIAWAIALLAPPQRSHQGLLVWLRAGAVAAVLEVAYITLQALRGRASHFNFDTVLETFLYYVLMGGAALVMMAATIAVGLFIALRSPAGEASGRRLGTVLGLVLGSMVTLAVTVPLAAGLVDGPGHWVGGTRSDASGLPITGWSTTGGDLRAPHFFAVHLIQALPVAGWLGDRLLPMHARMCVWIVLVLGLGIVGITLAQAVAGQPFIALPVPVMGSQTA